MLFFALVLGFAAFLVAAVKWGVETRPGFDGLPPGDRPNTLR